MLQGIKDLYNCFHVAKTLLPPNFPAVLEASLDIWKKDTKAVWIEIPNSQLEFVKVCKDKGFYPHHVSENGIMMAKWLLDSENKLPGYSSHYIGAGGIIFRNQNEMLGLKNTYDKFGKPLWRVPGGLVESNETIMEGVVREVKEETGIDTRAIGVLGFREVLKFQFGQPDIYFLVYLEPLNFEIKEDKVEVIDTCWIPFDRFINETAQGIARDLLRFMYQDSKVPPQEYFRNIALRYQPHNVQYPNYASLQHFYYSQTNLNKS
ncbi:unnamed protein product [Blepharisma stoltei]|uniref:Nudix hydrolase domain-containing protein n=1 Tax=Blepharisma stoltei TaxID=1481888 RepID=A0AAU9K5X1_9CILI|nr:unnamed protein product [Blepharisma stoltei]